MAIFLGPFVALIGLVAVIIGIGLGAFVRLRMRVGGDGLVRLRKALGLKDDSSTSTPQHLPLNAPPPVASNAQLSPGSENELVSRAPGTFTYEELKTATDGFSNANFLGEGGFGHVYKGVLPNGKQVAVKQLKAGSAQGEREFQTEVEIISRVHYPHLVSLVGYCICGARRMLVYEFVPNNTLTFHLHVTPTMSWETRMKIALGSAKGVAYLHENCQPKIIHRDIKADNILLDDNFMAKIADFGLAKFFPDGHTHVSTNVKGTFGYLDPEYYRRRKLTDKSDVFSFGVVLLELITGRRPIFKTQSFGSCEGLVYWARPFLEQALVTGNFDTLVDPRLQDYSSSEMARMVHCAAACVRDSESHRPRMNQILRALEGNIPLDDLNEGITPGHSEIYNQDGSSNYMTPASTLSSDLNFNSMGLQSQELSTSEIRVPTN